MAVAAAVAVNAIPATIEGVCTTIDGICAYLSTRQEESTKRREIDANRDVMIARIEAERDTIIAYFGNRFAERGAALDELFTALRHATATGDNEQLVAVLGGILGIIQQNPLDDFETFKRKLQEPGYVIEI